MAQVKLEIDGQQVTGDSDQTILEVARRHGIATIPTLCHDRQLEPFASCFVCVVKVRGARTLLPACSTRVTAGMVVETNSGEVRQSRKAALELLLSDHYADCVGPCQLACPADVDIQGYIALAAIGRPEEAIALIKEHNPFPSVCGRVCTRPCEVKGCRRTLLDEAVGIDHIKRYVSDLDLHRGQARRPSVAAPNGRKVAVVGAGPAGLSAAYYLALRGYGVDIFEAEPEAGGMLRYGIPEYRLPKDVLDFEIGQILALGPRLHTGTALGRDFTVASLEREGYDAIFLAIGAWRSALMRVEGEQAAGVLSGIQFLENFGLRRPVHLHGTVAVVGGGNTALDCARTALRLGVGEVKLLYRRTRAEMPANDSEVRDALEEGVKMEFLVAPTRVVVDADGRVRGLECQRMELGAPDASGRRSPKPVRGSEHVIPVDFVIAAIGQSTTVADLVDANEPALLPAGQALGLTRWQTVEVNADTFETTVKRVFAGGDVVTGAATAIEAIAAGRKAAYAIDTYVREGAARPEPRAFFSRKDTFARVSVDDLRSQVSQPKRAMPLRPVAERVAGFAEVELGYSPEDVAAEATRCLECGCTALFDCDLRKYATEYGVEVTRFLGEARQHARDDSHPLIELDPNKCILCARCVRICSDLVGVAAFGFVNRGFSTVIAPALGNSLLDTDCVSCGLCVGTCPTGAIAQKFRLAKPGPWLTERTPSVCAYCGVGCRIDYETHGDTLVKVSRNGANQVTLGDSCRKGWFGFDYVNSADRLTAGRVRSGAPVLHVPAEEAVREAAARLAEARRRLAGHEMAVFVSPRMTNEEAYLAQKFARLALGTHNVASLSHALNPALTAPDVLATATYRDVAEAQAILLVNSNLDEEHFVVDLMAKRAIRRGGALVAVGPKANRATALAEVFLQCAPEAEALVLQAVVADCLRRAGQDPATSSHLVGAVAGLTPAQVEERTGVSAEAIGEAAAVLSARARKVLVFNRDYQGPRRPHDARLMAAAASAIGCALLPLHEKANGQGLLDMGVHPAWYPGYRAVADEAAIADLETQWGGRLRHLDTRRNDVGRLLASGAIKAAVVFGEDPLGVEGLPAEVRAAFGALDLLVVADLFLTRTAAAADVVLPLSSSVETSGTFTNSERRVQRVRRAVAPRGGVETWQMIARLAGELGVPGSMAYSSPEDVFAEIRRVAPIYRDVVVDAEEAAAIWDAGRAPLTAAGPEVAAGAPALTPAPTFGLDTLDARFEAWFVGLIPPWGGAPRTRS